MRQAPSKPDENTWVNILDICQKHHMRYFGFPRSNKIKRLTLSADARRRLWDLFFVPWARVHKQKSVYYEEGAEGGRGQCSTCIAQQEYSGLDSK